MGPSVECLFAAVLPPGPHPPSCPDTCAVQPERGIATGFSVLFCNCTCFVIVQSPIICHQRQFMATFCTCVGPYFTFILQ